ncbi:MAG: flavin-containing monooxygenase [Candidatus Promineifilaceae bacterium]
MEHIETVVVGGAQAGLATGYFLRQQTSDFVILDAHERIGDAWRQRWDSLRLFTPARYNGLPGMPFPAPAATFPTKDEMADYLEAYAARFELPVRTGSRVDRLGMQDGRYLVKAGDRQFEAENVVVAMGTWQRPKIPPFAAELSPAIVQLHSSQYRNPSQLRDGRVLVVGAANSGAEIALEVARSQPTWLAGREPGQIPFRIDSAVGRHILVPLVIGILFHHVLTVRTPMGRKMRQNVLAGHGPGRVRVKSADLAAAGIERLPRVAGARDGMPMLADKRRLDVANVIWCTGFDPAFTWIDLPVFGENGPLHRRGVVSNQQGLYFVGLPFTYAASSMIIRGVGRDAAFVADQIGRRTAARQQDKPEVAYAISP